MPLHTLSSLAIWFGFVSAEYYLLQDYPKIQAMALISACAYMIKTVCMPDTIEDADATPVLHPPSFSEVSDELYEKDAITRTELSFLRRTPQFQRFMAQYNAKKLSEKNTRDTNNRFLQVALAVVFVVLSNAFPVTPSSATLGGGVILNDVYAVARLTLFLMIVVAIFMHDVSSKAIVLLGFAGFLFLASTEPLDVAASCFVSLPLLVKVLMC